MGKKYCWRWWPNVGKGLRHLFQLLLSNLTCNCLFCICPFTPRRGFTFPLPGAAEAAESSPSLSAEPGEAGFPAQLQELQRGWGCSPAPPKLGWWRAWSTDLFPSARSGALSLLSGNQFEAWCHKVIVLGLEELPGIVSGQAVKREEWSSSLLNLKLELTFATSTFQFKEPLKSLYSSQQHCVGKYILPEPLLRAVNKSFLWIKGCPVLCGSVLCGAGCSRSPNSTDCMGVFREGRGKMATGK